MRTIPPMKGMSFEGAMGEGGPRKTVLPFARVHDHETGHRAHDHGVPERSGGGNQGLTHRIPRLCGRGHDRRASEAGFVREETAGDAVADGLGDAGADEAAHRRLPSRVRGRA